MVDHQFSRLAREVAAPSRPVSNRNGAPEARPVASTKPGMHRLAAQLPPNAAQQLRQPVLAVVQSGVVQRLEPGTGNLPAASRRAPCHNQ